MPYRNPPSEEEQERLKKHGEGCRDCESRGTHGGHNVCRRQVAGKYNRQIFYNRGDSSSRPNWCPKDSKNAKKGYATTEPLPEAKGEGIESPGPPYQTGPASPMPQNPKTHLERPVPPSQGRGGTYKGQPRGGQVPYPLPEEDDKDQVIEPAPKPPKEPKLKRKPKDAPWGQTEE